MGVSRDTSQAIGWYKKAIELNQNPEIRASIFNNLGVAYSDQLEYINAFDSYRLSAELGNKLGQLNLARMYASGRGTIQYEKEAYAWISVAIAQGLDDTVKQQQAENFKSILVATMNYKDRSGNLYKRATDLSKEYFRKFILKKPR